MNLREGEVRFSGKYKGKDTDFVFIDGKYSHYEEDGVVVKKRLLEKGDELTYTVLESMHEVGLR